MLRNNALQLTTNYQTIYELGPDQIGTTHALYFYNDGDASDTVEVELYSAKRDRFELVTRKPIEASGDWSFPEKINLDAGDRIRARSTNAKIRVLVGIYIDTELMSTTSFNPRGYFDPDAVYNRLDVVIYEGVSFVAVDDNITGSVPPGAGWVELVSGVNYKGQWDENQEYRVLSVVNHNNGVYVSVQDYVSGTEPGTDEQVWLTLGNRVVFRNEWDANTEYFQHDFVSYQNAIYYAAQKPATGTAPPDSNDWVVAVSVTQSLNDIEDRIDQITNWLTVSETDTLEANRNYLVDTSSSAYTVYLPPSPSLGDHVRVADQTNSWGTNSLTVNGNGSDVGETSNTETVLSMRGGVVEFVYNGSMWLKLTTYSTLESADATYATQDYVDSAEANAKSYTDNLVITGITADGNGTLTLSRNAGDYTADLSHSHDYADLPISSTDVSNWNTAYNNYINDVFLSGSGNGDLQIDFTFQNAPTLSKSTTLAHNHDNRYLQIDQNLADINDTATAQNNLNVYDRSTVDDMVSGTGDYSDSQLSNHASTNSGIHGLGDNEVFESVTGAQTKANQAETNAKDYTDQRISNDVEPSLKWSVMTDHGSIDVSQGLIVNTSSGAISVTLPSTPATGDKVAFADARGTWSEYPLTIDGNGNDIIESGNASLDVDVSHGNVWLVFDGTLWVQVN